MRHQEAARHIIMQKVADVHGVKDLWHCDRKRNIVVFRLPFSRPTNAGVMTLKGEIQNSSGGGGSHWATNLGRYKQQWLWRGWRPFLCIATELAPLQWVIWRCLLRCCERSNFKDAYKFATWRCQIWRTKHTNCELHESALAVISFILLASKELCCHSCKYWTKKDNGCRCELSRWAMFLQKVVVWDERCAFIQYCNEKFLLWYTCISGAV